MLKSLPLWRLSIYVRLFPKIKVRRYSQPVKTDYETGADKTQPASNNSANKKMNVYYERWSHLRDEALGAEHWRLKTIYQELGTPLQSLQWLAAWHLIHNSVIIQCPKSNHTDSLPAGHWRLPMVVSFLRCFYSKRSTWRWKPYKQLDAFEADVRIHHVTGCWLVAYLPRRTYQLAWQTWLWDWRHRQRRAGLKID